MPPKLPHPSGFYNYSRLALTDTKYSKRMNRLSAQIFGEPTMSTKDEHSPKLMQRFMCEPLEQRHTTVHYYDHARHQQVNKLMGKLRAYGLYRDEHADFAEEMERQRYLRGKGSTRWLEKNYAKYNMTKKPPTDDD